jgi:hypothetical protein
MCSKDFRGSKLEKIDFSNLHLLQHQFSDYLNDSVFTSREEKSLVKHILANGDACIFGGVIRDFLLNRATEEHRDIDMVVYEFDRPLEKYIQKHLIKKNRFGGYKLCVNDKLYDLWTLNDTWALKRYGKTRRSLGILPATSFFNVNAIIFSLRHSKFFMHKKFKQSIEDRMLDIVYEPNPCPELCIVKTYQLVNELHMCLSPKITEYVNTWFHEVRNKLVDIQVSHFGNIRYSVEDLERFVSNAQATFACPSRSDQHANPEREDKQLPISSTFRIQSVTIPDSLCD